MARSALSLLPVATLTLVACDRLPQRWPFSGGPSAVTVKLPPAKTVAPGFAFNDAQQHPAKGELR